MLLGIASKLSKREAKTFRIVASSAIGGVYSLILLIEDIPTYIFVLSKIAAAAILIITAFGFMKVKSFLRVLFIFLFANFVFLGIITGIQMLFKSEKICTNNGEIYFDINARELLLTALIAYIASCITIRLYNRKLGAGEIYRIIIENNSKEVALFALSDTGNKLREPFSDYPVIIVKKGIIDGMFDENKARLIPASTINSSSYLKAFKPDCVKVKTSKGYENIENVYVAVSEDMNSKSFSAIINPEIISV